MAKDVIMREMDSKKRERVTHAKSLAGGVRTARIRGMLITERGGCSGRDEAGSEGGHGSALALKPKWSIGVESGRNRTVNPKFDGSTTVPITPTGRPVNARAGVIRIGTG